MEATLTNIVFGAAPGSYVGRVRAKCTAALPSPRAPRRGLFLFPVLEWALSVVLETEKPERERERERMDPVPPCVISYCNPFHTCTHDLPNGGNCFGKFK